MLTVLRCECYHLSVWLFLCIPLAEPGIGVDLAGLLCEHALHYIRPFLTNLRSKVNLCTNALRWNSSGVGVSVGVHQNFYVELFSETINHRILKLGMMVVCNEGFPKMLSLITSRKGQRS